MVSRVSLLKAFFGSFFIQAAWSFEKMQTLGFAAAISPAIKDIFKGDARLRDFAVRRHMSFYNAHPYMASPVLGAAIRLEEAGMKGECPVDSALRFRSRMMAPLSAIGDSFFWASLRPLASCAGILAALIWGLWGPAVFLVLYNAVHLSARWAGLKRGYADGDGVIASIKSLELPKWAARARLLAMFILGVFTAYCARMALALAGSGAQAVLAASVLGATLVVTAALVFLLKRGWRVARLIYAVTLPVIIIGALLY